MTEAAEPLGDLLEIDDRERAPWKRVLLLCGAIFFFILGMVGWLIPVVTGIPFYIVGFAMLGLASKRCAAWINRMDRKLPHGVRVALRKAKRKKKD